MKMLLSRLIYDQRFRFVLIGGMNTIIDFGILNGLNFLGTPILIANTVSTGITMAISFVLNRKYTFKSDSKNHLRDIVLFVCFTLIGLWILQNLVIMGLLVVIPASLPSLIRLNGAKLLATGASMVWNFVAYKYVVFR